MQVYFLSTFYRPWRDAVTCSKSIQLVNTSMNSVECVILKSEEVVRTGLGKKVISLICNVCTDHTHPGYHRMWRKILRTKSVRR